jgi:acetyl esterase/lipase
MQTVAPETRPFPRYDPAARYDVKTFDVAYRRDGETDWLARIYQPQGPGPFPALMDVHGGAWTTSDRTSNAPMANALAQSGLVVVALDFRLAPGIPIRRRYRTPTTARAGSRRTPTSTTPIPATWAGSAGRAAATC